MKGDKVLSIIVFGLGVLAMIGAVVVYSKQDDTQSARFMTQLNELRGSQQHSLSKEEFDSRMAEFSESILDLKMQIIKLDARTTEEVDKRMLPLAAENHKIKSELDILKARHFGIEKKMIGLKREINVNFSKDGPIEVEIVPRKKTETKKTTPKGAMLRRAGISGRA